MFRTFKKAFYFISLLLLSCIMISCGSTENTSSSSEVSKEETESSSVTVSETEENPFFNHLYVNYVKYDDYPDYLNGYDEKYTIDTSEMNPGEAYVMSVVFDYDGDDLWSDEFKFEITAPDKYLAFVEFPYANTTATEISEDGHSASVTYKRTGTMQKTAKFDLLLIPLYISFNMEINFKTDHTWNWGYNVYSMWKNTTSEMFDSSYFIYGYVSPGHMSAEFYTGKEANVTIPERAGAEFVISEVNNFADMENLHSITIPDTVTTIGEGAFANCKNLEEVILPDSITSIGDNAFTGCDNLKLNEYENGLYLGTESNPYFALAKQKEGSITDFKENESCEIILSDAFENCTSLISITIPESVKTICKNAFTGCTALSEIVNKSDLSITAKDEGNGGIALYAYNVISDEKDSIIKKENGLTIIGSEVIYYNGTDENVTVPDYVTTIRNGAFANQTMTSITLPFIGGSETENNYLGYLFGPSQKGDNSLVPSTLKKVIISDKCTSIKEYAFSGCNNLTDISVPESVTSIGDYAFENCDSLNLNSYDNGLYIGNETNPYLIFAKASDASISSCTIHEDCRFILSKAFENCKYLPTITIPEKIVSIGDKAFYDCNNLIEVVNKSSLEITKDSIGNGYVGYHAYSVVTDEKDCELVHDNGLYIMRNRVILYDGTDENVVIPDDVTSIRAGSIAGSNIKSITLPFIGESTDDHANKSLSYIFRGDEVPSSLKEVIISDKCTSIESGAFEGCAGLTSVTIGKGVKTIGSYAFENCTGLKEITIPESVTSIGSSAFSGCSSLESITLPFVGDKAYTASDTDPKAFGVIFGSYRYNGSVYINQFSGSYSIPASLKNVTIRGCTTISKGAFYRCENITAVTIGKDVTEIAADAFGYCNNLSDITFEGTIKEWNAITKDADWNYEMGTYTVHCTDGDTYR